MLGSKAAEKGDKTDRCLSTTVGCEDSIGSTTSGRAVTGWGVKTKMVGGWGTITLRRIRFLLNSHEDGCRRVELNWILWGTWGNARGPESVKSDMVEDKSKLGAWLTLDISVSSSSSLSSYGLLSLFVVILSLSLSPLFSSSQHEILMALVHGEPLPFPLPRLASSSFIMVKIFVTGFEVFFTRLRLRDHGFAWGMGVFCGHGGMVHRPMLYLYSMLVANNLLYTE